MNREDGSISDFRRRSVSHWKKQHWICGVCQPVSSFQSRPQAVLI